MFRAFWTHMVRWPSRKSRSSRRPAQPWRKLWNVRPQLQFLENRVVPAGTYTVTNLSDAMPPPVGVDLRQAVALANADPGATIQFADGMNGTITLTQGDLDITANMTIDGTGHSLTMAGGGDRILDISAVGTVTINNLTIRGGRAPVSEGGGNGGGIYDASPSSILILNNDHIQLNFASGTGSGGGVYSNGRVTLNSSTVEANNAPNHGGGLFAGQDLTVNDSTIDDNVGGSGGGAYEGGTGTTVALNRSTVTHNRTTHGDGGGVFAEFNIMANQSSVTTNTALGGSGGGLFSESGNVTLQGTSVTANTATEMGGGVKADFDVLLTNASHVDYNIGNAGGGGIWSDDGFVAVTGASTVSNNTAGAGTAGATASGGGIWSGTDVLLANGTVADNTANGNGGGIFALGMVTLSSGSVVSGNNAVSTDSNGDGGGIHARLDVVVTSSQVSGNSAGRDGGGIHADGNIFLFAMTSVANNTAGRNGGGIWASPSSNVTIDSSTVTANTVANDGGGVYQSGSEGGEESGSLFISSSTISYNFALHDGGGVFAAGTEALTVLYSTIANNTAALNGGGLASDNVLNVSITNSSVLDNDSLSGSGGGIYLIGADSNADMDTDQIMGNTAGVSGGGVYVQDSPDVKINDVTFDNNVSFGGPQTGSALFAAGTAVVYLSNSDFDDTNGSSALLSTQLISHADSAVCYSGGGNEVADSSWTGITGFSALIGDHGNQ